MPSNKFAELHLHIEGTLERPDSPRSGYSNLQDFLNSYYQAMTTLKSREDYLHLAESYFKRVHKTGLAHVEAFFDPQTHKQNGNDFALVFSSLAEAFLNAEAEYGITARLILCFERDRGPEAAEETFAEAVEFLERPENSAMRSLLVGVGLDSAEASFPPAPFARVYEQARNFGLNAVAHAGEEGGAANIWSALDDLGAKRIDHGIAALEDAALLKRLENDRIPLTVCPLSNYALQVVSSKKEAVRKVLDLLEHGVLVTINSDDPAYFGGYIDDNYQLLRDEGVDEMTITQLMQNSLEAVF